MFKKIVILLVLILVGFGAYKFLSAKKSADSTTAGQVILQPVAPTDVEPINVSSIIPTTPGAM